MIESTATELRQAPAICEEAVAGLCGVAGRLHSLKAAYPPHPIGGRLRKAFEESPQPQTAASGAAAALAPLELAPWSQNMATWPGAISKVVQIFSPF